MSPVTRAWLAWIAATLLACSAAGAEKTVHIPLPKSSKPTPVQKLNQDGVRALDKHDYKKAREIFYKAYLLDPNDPFTLNNLGYIAELDGQVDRAQRYYALAADQNSDAIVAKSTEPLAIGKPVDKVAGNAVDAQMEINRANVYAMGLLQKDRAPEADLALQKALKLDANNAFTLNNLGFAKEKEGELEDAYRYYSNAARENSTTPVVVTLRRSWRGKPISEVAAKNADEVKRLMQRETSVGAKVARFNTRGVAAINRNDYKLARHYFDDAYKLDNKNAFALNNMGYLAELDGDRETADFYYAKAREANQSNARIAYATRKDAEGQKLAAVANQNDQAVVDATEQKMAALRRQGGPVILRYRDNQPVVEPAVPPKPEPTEPIGEHQPSTAPGGLMEPLPDNQQPAAAQPNQGQQPANSPGGLLMPLPDNQQPPASQPQGQQPPQEQQQPPQAQGAQPQATSPANSSGGLLMPLPDDQQPDVVKQPPNQPPPK